jgi:hypothetical protein
MIDTKQLEELTAKARAAQEAGRLDFKVPPNAPQAWIDYFDAFRTATILSLIDELEQARMDAVRLNFLIDKQAAIVSELFDDTFTRYSCFCVDKNENIVVLSGEDKSYPSPRDAIDAALSAQEGDHAA